MTQNEIPAALPVQHEDDLDFVEASGEIEISELSSLQWRVEGVEDDHATLSMSFDAHSVEDFDRIMAQMAKARSLMAQAQAVCGS